MSQQEDKVDLLKKEIARLRQELRSKDEEKENCQPKDANQAEIDRQELRLRCLPMQQNDECYQAIEYQPSIDTFLWLLDPNQGTVVIEKKYNETLTILCSALKGNDEESNILRHGISLHLDKFVKVLSMALQYIIYEQEFASSVQLVVNALSLIFRTIGFAQKMSQSSIECVVRECIRVLLNDRLHAMEMEEEVEEISKLMKSINKLVQRAVLIPTPLETSLLALLSLQKSILERSDDSSIVITKRVSRVLQKLYIKVMVGQQVEQFDQLSDDVFDSISSSLDLLTRTIDVKKLDVLSDDMFEHAEFMLVDLRNRLEELASAKLKRLMKQKKLKAKRRKTLSAAVAEVRFTSALM